MLGSVGANAVGVAVDSHEWGQEMERWRWIWGTSLRFEAAKVTWNQSMSSRWEDSDAKNVHKEQRARPIKRPS
jgi:hypothetical protein